MSHQAKILADSVSLDGARITTFEITFPRIILAEFNTHRMFSRNSASSRAIPVEKMIKMVQEHPYIPTHWGKNQKGMQAEQEVDGIVKVDSERCWLRARDSAVEHTKTLLDLGIHKQITNRLLEPFMWHTVIVTATEWNNYFHLRDHAAAHPEIQLIAHMMRELYETRKPAPVSCGHWHLPLVNTGELFEFDAVPQHVFDPMLKVKVSAGRCARVSYLTHEGKRDPAADVALCEGLLGNGHMSPLEHPATPFDIHNEDHRHQSVDIRRSGVFRTFVGNFQGWVQYRKLIKGEHDMLGQKR